MSLSSPAESGDAPRIERVYVLKKEGMDPDGRGMLHFMRDQLGIATVLSVRTGYRYDISGVGERQFPSIVPTVLSESPVNDVFTHDEFEAGIGAKTVLMIESQPGQYNQMADGAQQCIRLNFPSAEPTVRPASVMVIDGALTAEQLSQLKDYCINKTDSREASRALPQSLHEMLPTPGDVKIIGGFGSFSEDALSLLMKTYGLAMTIADLRCVQGYFQEKGRDPTVTEIKVIDTYWSDHCRHTTFATGLVAIALNGQVIARDGKPLDVATIPDNSPSGAIAKALTSFIADRNALYGEGHDKEMSLMDLALFSLKEARTNGRLDDMEDSAENNAASIVVPVHFKGGRVEEWLFMFKNETHNHPTEIEPYGGAATCLGGAIRDPLSGRSCVFFGMRITGSGDPRTPISETLPNKLPQRRITTGALAGFAGYGNQIGVPTTFQHEYFHPGYVAKRMEVGFVGAAASRANIVREEPAPGDVVILLGGKTGRDGIGGATGSSKELTQESVVTCAAEVQKGDPVQERKIQRFFRNPAIARMIKRCNDFGAGGVSVAIGELAPGLLVNLDAVPLKYDGLDGTEIAISESQERMAVVVPADKTKEFIAAAAAENLDATVVAHVTEEAVLRQQWRGKTICELDRTLLDGGWAPRQAAVDMTVPADVRSYFTNMPAEITESTLADQWRENLQRLSVASQRGMQQRFDSTVGANSIVSPYGGMYQSTPSDVSVMRFPAEGATTAAITSASFDPELSTLSPFHGAMFAVIDSVARIVAAGGDPEKVRLTLQNYFGRLSDAQRWGQPFLAQLGAREAQKHLGTPAIGGKDSMSGTTKNTLDGSRIDVPPTLVSFAAGTMEESDVLPDHFQTFGSTVVQLPIILDEAGMPDWVHLKKTWQKIKELHELGSICSSRAVHAGGVAAALTKMALGNRVGFSLVPPKNPADLYVPSYGSIILELKMPDVLRSLGDIPYILLGRTQEGAAISTGRSKEDMSLPLMQLLRQWEKPLDSVFPLSPDQQGSGKNILRSSIMNKRGARPHGPSIARPRATVLTFPGTNCEMETAAAFERAGAAVRTELFVNRTRTAIKDSLKRFAEAMKDSHILAIPGGFSAGDQPDGSAKFIAAVLRNMRISDAVHEHLERGGLILGICNGFQALAKSCLLPSGHIRVQGSDDTTLVHNTNGHFLSMNSMHRVISTMSPWMSKFDHHETADFPIAHGEGRLINVSSDLWINGQVPFQYAARDGNVRDDFPSNPNGSQDAIAALTDPSGKIFGMMAHPERALPGLSMNIPTKRKGQKLFDGAISYFQ